ncbi:MAG: sugar kinase [Candidatus Doudnabacteria bacterium CG10_big_fil_rev_8_21_14_0_10_42_18]|uniref:Sugar kinase n=1 Tax=Candidatus Doudnabacteria bacterium CG10_big_fil_rev_8_21_14_0_10_42_18 TaxID=1974552 RepID=A0A2H0VA34_9BACT|nr:MAG: sugar kinase [Candidatus Doudnabacteria bacterium CG10_big_fil_rev_8_21_14_0_10_42_18]
MIKKLSNKLLTIGSVAFDSIETPFGKINKALGGSATYFSLASSLFTPTAIVGVVGNDFGKFDVYRKREIDITGLEKRKGKTFHWSGKYHFDMNTRDTLKTELGVFADFKPKLDDNHKASEYVFLGNIQPKLQLDVLQQMKKPKLVGLDTMNLWIETARKDLFKVMKEIDILVINDGEARQLSKETNLLKAAKKILRIMGSQKSNALIIKQGEHGLLMFADSILSLRGASATKQSKTKIAARPPAARNDISIFNLPGYPLENVIDPTGAGDSFAGGFMGYLAKTDDLSYANLKKACVYGSAVASFTVENFGTKALEILTAKKIEKRYILYKQLIHI